MQPTDDLECNFLSILMWFWSSPWQDSVPQKSAVDGSLSVLTEAASVPRDTRYIPTYRTAKMVMR